MKKKCSDLGPIIMLLEQHGNVVIDDTHPHDAPDYVTKNPIDFDLILERYDLADNLHFDRNNDIIFNVNTWGRLTGPNYRE